MPELEQTVVLLGGSAPPSRLPLLDGVVRVLAADSGLHLAGPLGLHVDVVVGDLDSVDPEALAEATANGTKVQVHPADKDASDLELTLRHAVTEGARRILVIGGADGRADHHLANVAVLGAPWLANVEVVAVLGDAHCTVVRTAAAVRGVPGSLVSLLPITDEVHGVTSRGLRWELTDATLLRHSTRGISNELLDATAEVELRGGVLLAVQPDGGTAVAPIASTTNDESITSPEDP